MRFLSIGLAFLSIIAASFGTPARAQQGIDLEIRAAASACHRLCTQSARACAGKSGPVGAACDTRAVVCSTACLTCNGPLSACIRSRAAGTNGDCTGVFGACIKNTIADGVTNRPPIQFKGGDGASQQTAVVIAGASGEEEGVAAEYMWLNKHFDAWRREAQAHIQTGGRHFDKLDVTMKDGSHAFWFDITAFFGRSKLGDLLKKNAASRGRANTPPARPAQ
jgi:hypothetical protein